MKKLAILLCLCLSFPAISGNRIDVGTDGVLFGLELRERQFLCAGLDMDLISNDRDSDFYGNLIAGYSFQIMAHDPMSLSLRPAAELHFHNADFDAFTLSFAAEPEISFTSHFSLFLTAKPFVLYDLGDNTEIRISVGDFGAGVRFYLQ